MRERARQGVAIKKDVVTHLTLYCMVFNHVWHHHSKYMHDKHMHDAGNVQLKRSIEDDTGMMVLQT